MYQRRARRCLKSSAKKKLYSFGTASGLARDSQSTQGTCAGQPPSKLGTSALNIPGSSRTTSLRHGFPPIYHRPTPTRIRSTQISRIPSLIPRMCFMRTKRFSFQISLLVGREILHSWIRGDVEAILMYRPWVVGRELSVTNYFNVGSAPNHSRP